MRELGEQVPMQPLYGSHFSRAVSSSMFAAPTTCDGSGMGCHKRNDVWKKYQKPHGLKSIGKSQLPKELGEDIRPMPKPEEIIPGEPTPEDVATEETFEQPGEQTVQEDTELINPNAASDPNLQAQIAATFGKVMPPFDKVMPPILTTPTTTTSYPPYYSPTYQRPQEQQTYQQPGYQQEYQQYPPAQQYQATDGFVSPPMPIAAKIQKWIMPVTIGVSALAVVTTLFLLLRRPRV